VINVAAEEVSPAEVERVLAAHPQVVDVQVIGPPTRSENKSRWPGSWCPTLRRLGRPGDAEARGT
jgi:acyl-CoA synthetase (AMP-forming)/AMP-acid ligase II